MSWTPEQKEQARLRRIEKWGSEENYRKHMRDIAAFRPSQDSIEKHRATMERRYGKDVWRINGSKGGRKPRKKSV